MGYHNQYAASSEYLSIGAGSSSLYQPSNVPTNPNPVQNTVATQGANPNQFMENIGDGQGAPTGIDTSQGSSTKEKGGGPDAALVGAIADAGVGIGTAARALTDKNEEVTVLDTGSDTLKSDDIEIGGNQVSSDLMKKEAEIDGKNQAVGSALTSIGSSVSMLPGAGTIVGGALSLAGGLASAGVFKSRNKEEDRKKEDQANIQDQRRNLEGTEQQSRRQMEIQKNFALGGYTEEYLNIFKEGGPIQEITTGGTHEQNPNGGVVIGEDEQGVPNMAEEGELVVKLPSGEFVFSNKF